MGRAHSCRKGLYTVFRSETRVRGSLRSASDVRASQPLGAQGRRWLGHGGKRMPSRSGGKLIMPLCLAGCRRGGTSSSWASHAQSATRRAAPNLASSWRVGQTSRSLPYNLLLACVRSLPRRFLLYSSFLSLIFCIPPAHSRQALADHTPQRSLWALTTFRLGIILPHQLCLD